MLIWLALSSKPAVPESANLSHLDIARAEAILRQNNPRYLVPGTLHSITINQQDLSLAANYLLHRTGHGGARIDITENAMQVESSIKLPAIPIPTYLNVWLAVEESEGQPEITKLKLGSLTVPTFMANLIVHELLTSTKQTREYQLAHSVIQQFNLQPDRLNMTYQWRPDQLGELSRHFISGADSTILLAYHAHLMALQSTGTAMSGSAANMMKPMFKFAQARSIMGDPIAENRALLLVLGAWASGHGMSTLVPTEIRHPWRFSLTLEQRIDFAQHFLTSAAIAAGADISLSNAVGVYKEVSDSKGGSGFSFTDIAADRAGTRFGELATASPENARRVQKLLSEGVQEKVIIPRVGDLPESMPENVFKQRFGDVGSAIYLSQMAVIEKRIADCKLYKGN
ncbi:hypothetical protein [Sulfurirhabdus autotrophica]|uniref:hypothetical protein n=1 Tax=Sulfurirhabdus autotrophica TaxID=1706046 RepID=UPI000F6046D0|nr:hypothetical protein [Sulfurirhabdus autotrophica]